MTVCGMTFFEMAVYCATTEPEIVANFDRLYDANLSTFGKRAPLEQMIDRATGRERDTIHKWLTFVHDCIWTRLPPDPPSAGAA